MDPRASAGSSSPLPGELTPKLARAIRSRFERSGVRGASLDQMIEVLAAYLKVTAAAAARAEASEQAGRDVPLEKVRVKDLALATEGRMTETQVRHLLDRGAFPHDAVRMGLLRELWAARTPDALLIDMFSCHFDASTMNVVTLHALGSDWAAILGGGAYRPDSCSVDEEDLKLIKPVIDSVAMSLGIAPATGALPVMLATDYSVAYNWRLREAIASWCAEYALPVDPEYVDVRAQRPVLDRVDRDWMTRVCALFSWGPDDPVPAALPVVEGRHVTIAGEHIVPFSLADGRAFALVRPKQADRDGRRETMRCRELTALLAPLSARPRAFDLRLQYFSHINATGWSRMMTVLCLAQVLETGCLS